MRSLGFVLLLLCAPALAEVQVQDDSGHRVTLAAPAIRIVSLAPNLTELLYDAGAGDRVVGAVDYSDFPPQARALPRVGSAAGINLEAVLALHPDLVIAWPGAANAGALGRLQSLGVPVFRSEPRELEDVARTLVRLGVLAGTEPTANDAASAFLRELQKLAERYSRRPKVSVFFEVWDRPLITVSAQQMIGKLIALCGGKNVFAGLPGAAPHVDIEAVLRANPSVIVASAPGSGRPEWLDAWKAFRGLDAVAHGRVYAVPADLIERPTPRVLEGAGRLCRILESARKR